MLGLNGCFCTAQTSCPLFLAAFSSTKLRCLAPLRTLTFKYGFQPPEKESEKPKLIPLTGLDDPNYTENVKLLLRHPKLLKESYKNLFLELQKFYNEERDRFSKSLNPCIETKHDRIDILFKFEKQEDLNGFSIHTDSSFSSGFSSGSLKISQKETAEFSGYICEDPPKDGNVDYAGYVSMMFPKQRLSFFRTKRYNWMEYSHLVLKIRGDGRTYLVLLHTPYPKFEESKYIMFGQPMYTRGGPYWQIVKMPFSHFFFMLRGGIPKRSNDKIPLSNVSGMSILSSSFDGPFKLEIDYVGLTFDKWHKTTSPYEMYKA